MADGAALDPAYRYLRAVVDGRSALLVLGYTDTDPATPAAAPIEVWYSAEGELIRLQTRYAAFQDADRMSWQRR